MTHLSKRDVPCVCFETMATMTKSRWKISRVASVLPNTAFTMEKMLDMPSRNYEKISSRSPKYLQGMIDMAIEALLNIQISSSYDPFEARLPFMKTIPFLSWIVSPCFMSYLREKAHSLGETTKRRSIGLAENDFDRKGTKRMKLYVQRIVAAFALSSAIAYCHKRRINHREVKPANIAFDTVRVGGMKKRN